MGNGRKVTTARRQLSRHLIIFYLTSVIASISFLIQTFTSAGAILPAVGYQFDVTTHDQFGEYPGALYFTGDANTETGFIIVRNNGASTFDGTINVTGKARGRQRPQRVVQRHVGARGSGGVRRRPGLQRPGGGFNLTDDGSSNGIQIALNGSVTTGANSEPVNLAVFDKDIHLGTPRDVHALPSTESGTPLFSDSYVLEGGDPSGGSTGHVFETAQADGHLAGLFFRGRIRRR
jgi:hypothetical protein